MQWVPYQKLEAAGTGEASKVIRAGVAAARQLQAERIAPLNRAQGGSRRPGQWRHQVVLPLMVKLFQWHTITSGDGDSKGITSFIGLDPQPYESGSSVRKHLGISKMGDSELHRLLYMGALGSLRGDNPLKTFYHRLVGRGKIKKVALVAAARKLLTWAWTIFSRQLDWNPNFHQIGA